MMANPKQRDTVLGVASSANAEEYRARRQGDLTRRSGGYRTNYPIPEPRRELRPGYKPDPPLAPYHYNPASPAQPPWPAKPNTHAFLRQPDLGAPRVGYPDAKRTSGKLQRSGAAWGAYGGTERPTLRPRVDGQDGPPTLAQSVRPQTDKPASASGKRWKQPDTPILRDHLPH
jgi:hypothetical protein